METRRTEFRAISKTTKRNPVSCNGVRVHIFKSFEQQKEDADRKAALAKLEAYAKTVRWMQE